MVDVEILLRRLGERQVRAAVEEQPFGPWAPVAVAAGALTALGRLDTGEAATLVAEYDAASACRRSQSPGHVSVSYNPPAVPPAPAAPPRVVSVARRYATDWGRLDVHYAVLGQRTTELVVTLHLRPTRGLTAFGEPGLAGWTDGTLIVADDRGGTTTAEWSGADVHTAERRRGWLLTSAPLAADARWLDVGGRRIDLGPPAPPTAVRFTPDPPPPGAAGLLVRLGEEIARGLYPAERYREPDRSPVEVILETLIAAGELATDDPAVAQVRLLAAARLAPPGTPAPPGLTEPWATLLGHPHHTDAPWAVRTLSGTVPAVNGLPFALVAVTSTSAYAELRLVELAATGPVRPAPPPLLDPSPYGGGSPPGSDATTWTAVDDLRHHHQGTFVRHGTPGQRAYVMLQPALHPDAGELRLTATGPEGRADLTVALDWEEPHEP
jgi:hypothetical protein